jgi:hypothetical protein
MVALNHFVGVECGRSALLKVGRFYAVRCMPANLPRLAGQLALRSAAG